MHTPYVNARLLMTVHTLQKEKKKIDCMSCGTVHVRLFPNWLFFFHSRPISYQYGGL